MPKLPEIKFLGRVDYEPTWRDMQDYTLNRNENDPDKIWFLEHPPVFTQGMNGKAEHVLFPGDIPVIPIDRGGQVTYHGPGQLVVYPLIDLNRLKLNVRDLVCAIEKSIIACVAEFNIEAYGRRDAPGVYVDEKKIASIGLRIKNQCTYHGLALNVDMDLEPFSRINPCGYQNLQMTDIQREAHSANTSNLDLEPLSKQLCEHLLQQLGYSDNKVVKAC